MANRKRPIVLRCPVTLEERELIEQKMAQFPTQRIGAYLRKMVIDGYIINIDTTDAVNINICLSLAKIVQIHLMFFQKIYIINIYNVCESMWK